METSLKHICTFFAEVHIGIVLAIFLHQFEVAEPSKTSDEKSSDENENAKITTQ
jgi:hypothetical protein